MLRETFNNKWWDQWRNYKTRRGARAYAKKNQGLWAVIEMNPKLLTAKERKILGNWVVGRADEYLFYEAKNPDDFNENFPVHEWWQNGVCLKTWEEACNFTTHHTNRNVWKEELESLVKMHERGALEVKSDIEALCEKIILECLPLN